MGKYMYKKIILFILMLTAGVCTLFPKGVNVFIDQIISDDFPNMEAYVSVTDAVGAPMTTLVPGNFSVVIDGKKVEGKVKGELFQYSDVGIAYALLVSANGLMEGEALAEQQRAIVNLMENMRDQDTLSVYYFGEDVKTLFEFQKKNESLLKEASKITTLGSNPKLYDALVYATRRLGEAKEKRKVLLVMSDGRDIESNYTRDQFLKIIDDLNIPMYACGIYMMGGRNLSTLNAMANHTGGAYAVAGSPSAISTRIKNLSNQVVLGYTLHFQGDVISGDNQFHQLQITANKDGSEDTFTKNFLAVKVPFPLWLKIVFLVVGILLIILLIVIFLMVKRNNRKKLGITRRKCPVCKRRMKDDWDECPFCKYLPPKKKKKEKKQGE